MNAELTTLCYIEQDGKYLMMHRTRKNNDINKDKWIGVGGHFEENESPEECLFREVKEETGLTLTSFRLRGVITFRSGDKCPEYMFLYTADRFDGLLTDYCNEGELVWVNKKDVYDLNLWEGDRIFFRLLETEENVFSLKLTYDENGKLLETVCNGIPYTG